MTCLKGMAPRNDWLGVRLSHAAARAASRRLGLGSADAYAAWRRDGAEMARRSDSDPTAWNAKHALVRLTLACSFMRLAADSVCVSVFPFGLGGGRYCAIEGSTRERLAAARTRRTTRTWQRGCRRTPPRHTATSGAGGMTFLALAAVVRTNVASAGGLVSRCGSPACGPVRSERGAWSNAHAVAVEWFLVR